MVSANIQRHKNSVGGQKNIKMGNSKNKTVAGQVSLGEMTDETQSRSVKSWVCSPSLEFCWITSPVQQGSLSSHPGLTLAFLILHWKLAKKLSQNWLRSCHKFHSQNGEMK